jgi:formylglycine-generating enzyme required for sulfatase activity
MVAQQTVDITELATLSMQFPLSLMQLGFRLIQVIDESGRDSYRYVIPPTSQVPAGPFLMGSDPRRDSQAHDKELPQHTVQLPAYHIGTFPLTVVEYACFVETTQHREPVAWQIQLTERPDHPVVNISQDEANEYASWLTQMTKERWRLPTEEEWEKAARGADGRIYPWGDQWDKTMANTNDAGPGMTTPVGSYPRGASPYGVQDMAGNVMEWTSTHYMSYHYHPDTRHDHELLSLVIRGGSWHNDPQSARVACRHIIDNPLDKHFPSLGMRLVRENVSRKRHKKAKRAAPH